MLGQSGSGKTQFLCKLLQFIAPSKVYVFTKGKFRKNPPLFARFICFFCLDPDEFKSLVLTVQPLITTPPLNHDYFVANFSPGSWVIVDDFAWSPSSEERTELQTLLNFTLRHCKVTLILTVHNVFFSKLYNEISLCSNVFLTFSNQAKKYLLSQGKAFKHVSEFFAKNRENRYAIAYFSNIRELFVLNCHPLITVNSPFSSTKMLYTSQEYIIHNSQMPCDAGLSSSSASSPPPQTPPLKHILDEVLEDYPKQKKAVRIILRTLSSFIRDENLFVQLDEKHEMHLIDFISLALTPIKRSSLTPNQTKFLKKLKLLGLKWPTSVFKNPQVRALVT